MYQNIEMSQEMLTHKQGARFMQDFQIDIYLMPSSAIKLKLEVVFLCNWNKTLHQYFSWKDIRSKKK